jgi:hypothetical protein
MSVSGGEPVKTLALPDTVNFSSRLRWTPDSKAVMYKDSVQGLWRQPLNSEKPELVKGFEDKVISQFAWSQDGKNLVYSRGTIMRDIVLLENSK